jgi:DNA-binding beta-propeller fold protein YncE
MIALAGKAMMRNTFAALTTGLLFTLAACATTEKPKAIEMFWPDPPDKPRIKYERSLQGKDELGGPSVLEVMVGKDASPGLHQPMGIAVSDDGQRIYVVDFAWNAVFVFDLYSKTLRFIGNDERFGLSRPIGIALDEQENVYVTDTGSLSVKVYDRSGKFLRSIGKNRLVRATGLAVDKKRRRLYVVDTGQNDEKAHQVKVFDLEGNLLSEIGHRGDGDGEFNFPTFAAVDSQGRLYVADTANFRVQIFGPDGKFIRKFGRAGNTVGEFGRPKAVALDSFGNVYVLDSHYSNVQIFNQQGEVLLTFGGTGLYPGLLLNPTAIAIDKQNQIYVSNYLGQRVDIYRLINTTAEDSFAKEAKALQQKGDKIQ